MVRQIVLPVKVLLKSKVINHFNYTSNRELVKICQVVLKDYTIANYWAADLLAEILAYLTTIQDMYITADKKINQRIICI